MSKIILDSTKNKLDLNLKELFAYKDLFLTLAYRDFKIRYAQTFLGFLWAFIQPIITLGIGVIVFNRVINVDTENIPYPLFALAGMCGWNYFSFMVTQAGISIIGAQSMISKIYFPRLIIPLSKAVVGCIDFAITIILFFLVMIFYGFKPDINLFYLPFFILITIISGLAAGIWLSALTIRYRDFQVILPYLIQAGLYITPIFYPVNLIPGKYKILFYLNPMTSVVQGFRWCLLGVDPPDIYSFVSIIFVVLIFIAGLFYFRKIEKVMADIL